MAIKLACPGCNKSLVISSELAGRTVRCKCGANIGVPFPEKPVVSAERSKRSCQWIKPALIGAMSGFVAGLAIGILISPDTTRDTVSKDAQSDPRSVAATPVKKPPEKKSMSMNDILAQITGASIGDVRELLGTPGMIDNYQPDPNSPRMMIRWTYYAGQIRTATGDDSIANGLSLLISNGVVMEFRVQ